jgi:hypothetical protein
MKGGKYESDKMENGRDDLFVWIASFFNSSSSPRPGVPQQTDQYGHNVLTWWIRRSFYAFAGKQD